MAPPQKNKSGKLTIREEADENKPKIPRYDRTLVNNTLVVKHPINGLRGFLGENNFWFMNIFIIV